MRILFVHNALTGFVVIDRDLLRERFRVREWNQRRRTVNPAALLRAVFGCDLVFGWFASWHTLWPLTLASLLRKPSILVIGGYDTASMPGIGYGHQRGGLRRAISRWTVDRARALITHSVFTQEEAVRNLGLPATRIEVVHLGVPDPWTGLPPGPRQAIALTVGKVDRSNLQRKGHEAFVRAAARLPEVEFVLAGRWEDDAIDRLRTLAPSNVTFPGFLESAQLQACYGKASVYVQPSQHEGFGLSVAEAMLAGCIPVVTGAGSLPEVVGDCGVRLASVDPIEVAAGIRQGLAIAEPARQAARERIATCFPVERRRARLHGLVEELAA